jgi:hypothetical protein
VLTAAVVVVIVEKLRPNPAATGTKPPEAETIQTPLEDPKETVA